LTSSPSRTFKFGVELQGGDETRYCSYPLRMDPYKAGCGNDCKYCYVRHRLYDMGLWRTDAPAVLDLEHLEKLFYATFSGQRSTSRTQRTLTTRLPVRVGMNTDPFQPVERKLGITRGLLKILKEYKYPYVLLTKNDLVARDDYAEHLDKDCSYVELTITSLNRRLSRQIEPYASEPEARLGALRKLTKAGFKTAVRINPLFPIRPDGYHSRGSESSKSPALDMFSWDLVNAVCACHPTTLIVGFLRFDSARTHRWMTEATGIDFRQFFTECRGKYYTAEEISYYYRRCKEIADRHGVQFSVCFDRNENYRRFKDMWHNEDDCCNALGQTPCFRTQYRMVADKVGR
jgi:DNA repair photolyase